KNTIAKHQCRQHQQGISTNSNLGDYSLDLDDNKPDLTPRHSVMIWSPHDIFSMDQEILQRPSHRTTSYANFKQQTHGQHMP
ncbi:hypothetical protein DER44DRAFT_850347, partial [Fusarium oxysporum]